MAPTVKKKKKKKKETEAGLSYIASWSWRAAPCKAFASLTSLRTVYSIGKPEADAGNEQ